MKKLAKTKPLTDRERSVLGLALRAWSDPYDRHRETFIALPEEKPPSTSLETRGLVAVRRTAVLFAGYHEWWVKLTPAGVAFCKTDPKLLASLGAAELAVLAA